MAAELTPSEQPQRLEDILTDPTKTVEGLKESETLRNKLKELLTPENKQGWFAELECEGKDKDFRETFERRIDEFETEDPYARLKAHAYARYPDDSQRAKAFFSFLKSFLADVCQIDDYIDTDDPNYEGSEGFQVNLHPLIDYIADHWAEGQLGAFAQSLSVLDESFNTDDADIDHYVELYKQRRRQVLRELTAKEKKMFSWTAFERLGLNNIIAQGDEYDDFLFALEREVPGLREAKPEVNLAVAEDVAVYQALVFAADDHNSSDLRAKAKRQAEILAKATGRELTIYEHEELFRRQVENRLRELAEREVVDPDKLLTTPTVIWSVEELARWIQEPANQSARHFADVIVAPEPSEQVIALAEKLGPNGIKLIIEGFEDKAVMIRDSVKDAESLTDLKRGEDNLQRAIAKMWADNLKHEMTTPFTPAVLAFQMLVGKISNPEIIGNALKAILREHLLLENIKVLAEFKVFNKEGAPKLDSIEAEFNPGEESFKGAFNRAATQATKVFRGILGEKLKDLDEIESLEVPSEEAKGEALIRHMILNLLVNTIIHTETEGGKVASDVVVKTDGQENTFIIESELPEAKIEEESGKPDSGRQRWLNALTRFSLSDPERYFNGRNVARASAGMSATFLSGMTEYNPQGLGLGVAVARLLAAKLGMEIEYKFEGRKVTTLIRPKTS